MAEPRVVVVSGGLRVPSSSRLLADLLAAEVGSALRAAGAEPELRTIELRGLAHEVTDALLTGFPAGALREAVDAVLAADALVVVTPTFSASYSGLFKSFFDVLEMGSLEGTPVLLAATGGTERHSLVLEYALRPLFVYLGAEPVPTGVYAATADFGGGRPSSTSGEPSAPTPGPAAADSSLADRIARAARELARAVVGGLPPRLARTAGDGPDDGLVPFEDLRSR